MEEKYIFKNEIILKTKLFTIAQDWEVPIPWFFIIAPLRTITSIYEFTG